MRIYVAGPMTGLPELNFPAFNAAAAALRSSGDTVFNPAELGFAAGDYRQALTACLAWICAQADAIALLPGWENSPGARAERATAEALGLEIIELQPTSSVKLGADQINDAFVSGETV